MRRFFSSTVGAANTAAKRVARQSEYYAVSGPRKQLATVIRTKSLPRGTEVESLNAKQVEEYRQGEHWHAQPHVLVLKADASKAVPVDGLKDVHVFPQDTAVKPCLLHQDRGWEREVLSDCCQLEAAAAIKSP